MPRLKRCAHGLCTSDSRYPEKPHMEGVTFFPFPSPKKDVDNCAAWVNACNREDFTVSSVKPYSYVCSKHFVDPDGPTTEHPYPLLAEQTETVNNRTRKRLRRMPSNPEIPVQESSFANGEENMKNDLNGLNIFTTPVLSPQHVTLSKGSIKVEPPEAKDDMNEEILGPNLSNIFSGSEYTHPEIPQVKDEPLNDTEESHQSSRSFESLENFKSSLEKGENENAQSITINEKCGRKSSRTNGRRQCYGQDVCKPGERDRSRSAGRRPTKVDVATWAYIPEDGTPQMYFASRPWPKQRIVLRGEAVPTPFAGAPLPSWRTDSQLPPSKASGAFPLATAPVPTLTHSAVTTVPTTVLSTTPKLDKATTPVSTPSPSPNNTKPAPNTAPVTISKPSLTTIPVLLAKPSLDAAPVTATNHLLTTALVARASVPREFQFITKLMKHQFGTMERRFAALEQQIRILQQGPISPVLPVSPPRKHDRVQGDLESFLKDMDSDLSRVVSSSSKGGVL